MAYTPEQFQDFVQNELGQPSSSFPWGPVLSIGVPVGAFGAGFIRTKTGRRVWDVYFRGFRHFEGSLPMGVGATFHGSEIISPFAAPNRFFLFPERHPELFESKGFRAYLSRITGQRVKDLEKAGAFTRGLVWKRTGSTLGTLSVVGGQPLASDVAALSTGLTRKGTMFEWFARVSGVRDAAFLTRLEETKDYLRPAWMPMATKKGGGLRLAGKFGYGIFSWALGRMNLLLQSPADLPVFEEAAKRIPILGRIKLGVKPGTGAQMLARYAGKAGLALGVYHGLKYGDYLAREYGPGVSAPFMALLGAGAGFGAGLRLGGAGRKAVIGGVLGGLIGLSGRGPISAVADVYSEARIFQAKISSMLGMGEGVQRTEDYFPGLTKPTTLIAAAGAGLLLGGTYDWGKKLLVARAVGKGGRGPTRGSGGEVLREVYEIADKEISARRELDYLKYSKQAEKQIGLSKLISQTKARWLGRMGKEGKFIAAGAGRYAALGAAAYMGLSTIGSLVSGDIVGAATQLLAGAGAAAAYARKGGGLAGLILMAPFLLREKEDPEKLRRIYSGEEEVPIRAGRWWEMGRCNTYNSLLTLNEEGDVKEAQDVTLEDTLIGADGSSHKILGIYKRRHVGQVIKIKTLLDRNIETGLTPNHIIPVIRPGYRYSSETGTYWQNKEDCSVEEISAEEIKIGDFVRVPRPLLSNRREDVFLDNSIKIGDFILDEENIIPAQKNWFTGKKQRSRGFILPRRTSLSSKLGRLIGYFLAEGNLSFKNDVPHMIETVHAKSEDWIVEDIKFICSTLFNITPTVRFKDSGPRTVEGCWVVRICSSLLSRVFFEWFYSSSRDNDKQFPAFCFGGTKIFRENIVLGYWRGDGHLDRGRKIISSCRKKLIDAMRIVLLDLGLYPTIPNLEISKDKNKDRQNSIKFRIGWRDNEKKPQGFIEKDGALFARVIAVEEQDYDDLVYDFEIDQEDHLVQNGTFLVHNSPYEGRRPYYRPHRIAMMRTGAAEAGLMGSEKAYWESDPIVHPIRYLLDPYAREKLMWEQGYKFPVSKTPFEDYPVVGPILAATIGRIIKPPKFMGREQWREEVPKAAPEGWNALPADEPVMRTGLTGTIGEQAWRLTEIFGLPGFVMQSIWEGYSGSQLPMGTTQWATPSLVAGTEPSWYSLQMGGLGLLSESIRRYIPRHGQCLVPGTPVNTDSGYVSIEDIKKGDLVLDLNGNLSEVRLTGNRLVDEKIVVLKTFYNNEELKLTSNHEIYSIHLPYCTSRGKAAQLPCYGNGSTACLSCPHSGRKTPSPEWIPAGDLCLTDFVQISTLPNINENIRNIYPEAFIDGLELRDEYLRTVKKCRGKLNSIRRSYSRTGIKDEIELNYDFGWLLGLYAAEGSSQKRGYIDFSLSRHEKSIADKAEEIICSIIDFAGCKVFHREERWKKTDVNTLVLHCACKPLMLLIKALVPGTAKTKKFHPILNFAPLEFYKGLFVGWLEGDGSIGLSDKRLRVRGCSVSRDLISFFKDLAFLFGYLPKISKNYGTSGKSPEGSWSYTIGFDGKDAHDIATYLIKGKDKVEKALPPGGGRGRTRVLRTQNGIFVGVYSLNWEEYKGLVYNLEVEETHSFSTNVCTVHNSVEYRNPLPTTLPSWLPQGGSYFLDFSSADIYSKIKEPWARLPGPGYCIHPDTKVQTLDWFKQISDIKVGDKVLTSDGYKAVVNTFSREFSGKLISIESYGSLIEPTLLTPEHRVQAIKTSVCKYHRNIADKKRRPCKVSNFCTRMKCDDHLSNTIEWIEASKLEVGDYVVLPYSNPEDNHFKIDVPSVVTKPGDIEYIGNNTYQTFRELKSGMGKIVPNKKIELSINDDYTTWFIFGLYVSEGYVRGQVKRPSGLGFAFHKKEQALCNLIKRRFGGNTRKKKINKNNNFNDNGNTIVHQVNNIILGLYVQSIFGRAQEKRLPPNLSKEQFIGLLSGWVQGDGTIKTSRKKQTATLTVSPVYKRLLSDLLFYLTIYNIDCSIRDRTDSGRGFEISFYASSMSLLSLINNKSLNLTDIQSKTSSNFVHNGFRAFKIKKIDEVSYEGLVYDLEVDECHEFTTSFIVHNSALHPELKGVAPEEYSNFWRHKVLGDLAPWSREYAHYNKIMSNMEARGQLTAEEILETEKTRRQVAETKRAREFQQYRYDSDLIQKTRVKVTGELEPGVYLTDTFGSAPVTLAGVDTSVRSLASVSMQRDASLTADQAIRTGQRKRAQISDFLRQYIYPGAEIDLYIHKDEASLMERGPGGRPEVPAVVSVGGTNINRELVEAGLAQSMDTGGPLDAKVGTTPWVRTFGKIWENLAHGAETPMESFTPFAPVAKFIHQRTALEEYQRAEVYGKDVAMWDKPWRNFLAPGLATTAWWAGWRGLPRETRERYMVEDYFDRLEYMKYKRLESSARAEGEGRLAAQYAGRAARTMMGVNRFSGHSARLALSSRERMYFEEFVRSPSAEERAEISQIVSPRFQEILHAQWAKRQAEQAQMRQEAGISREGDAQALARARAMQGAEARRQREEQIAMEMSQTPVPGPDWVGWCVPSDQEVLVSSYKAVQAEQITKGKDLWMPDLNPSVERIFSRNVSEKIISVSVCHNLIDSMKATKNHKVFALQGQKCKYNPKKTSVCTPSSRSWKCKHCQNRPVDEYKPQWVRISDLTETSFLCSSLLGYSDSPLTVDLLDFVDHKVRSDDKHLFPWKQRAGLINRFIELNEEVCWFIGLYLGDGNIWTSKERVRGVQITMAQNEVEILELANLILEKNFGISGKIYMRDRDTGKSACLKIFNKLLAEVINNWVGRYCDKKYPPSWLEKIPKTSQLSLLDGLLTADGSKDGRDVLGLTNLSLCRMAKRIWESNGFPATLRKVSKVNRKQQYSTYPLVDYTNVFYVGDKFIAYRINSINLVEYQGEVFDFEVPKTHCYQCHIGIYHNSPETDMEDYRVKTILDKDMDAPTFGIWRDDIERVRRRPWVTPIAAAFHGERSVMSPTVLRRRFMSMTGATGGVPPFITPTGDPRGRMDIYSPGYDRLDRFLRDPSILNF